MTTPTQHIRKVEAAAARLDKAKDDFHTAIRAAIAGGCSLRDVSAVSALGKSRIHDIARKDINEIFARAFESQGGVSPNRKDTP